MTLSQRLQEIVSHGPAELSVTVRHIERKEHVAVLGDRVMPTASVFKIPVMVELCRRVATGEISLDERWTLMEEAKTAGSGVLARLQPGLMLTVRDLLTLMIVISDNTATDMLVRRLEPARITATMRTLGLTATTVLRTIGESFATGLSGAPPTLAPYELARFLRENPPPPESDEYLESDAIASSTTDEMTELLSAIHTGIRMDALGIDASARAIMRRTLLEQQLNERLPRFLAPPIPVAHKTGSLMGTFQVRNDAGLIDMGERGTVAVAVFTRTQTPLGATPEDTARFQVAIDFEIAEIGRAVYEHYQTN